MGTLFSDADRNAFPWVAFAEQYAGHFGINRVLEDGLAELQQRTGFTWSELSGTLCLAIDRQYLKQALENPNIVGVITHSRFASELEGRQKLAVCCEKPAELFYAIHNLAIHRLFEAALTNEGVIAGSARIAPSAVIHDGVDIGEDAVIHDQVVIMPGTRIGAGSEIHPGVTLGTCGFFSKSILGRKTQVAHFGGVDIGDNCIIHAQSNVSRSVNYGERTLLASNVHMGIGANVAHDCKVAEDADISARVVLAGRVRVGRGCWIGAGALISNALTIGDGAEIKIGAVVIADVDPGKVISGNFAVDHKLQLKSYLSRK